MSRPTFIEGVGVAIAGSLFGGLLLATLATVLPTGIAVRAAITGLGLAYLLYLIRRSGRAIGRVTAIAAWLLGAALAWVLDLGLLSTLAAQLGLLWLLRVWFFHGGPLGATADLALVAFGVLAAGWAWLQTGGVVAALWSFFLVQALFGAIPGQRGTHGDRRAADTDTDRFQHAYRVAEAAVGRLSDRQTS